MVNLKNRFLQIGMGLPHIYNQNKTYSQTTQTLKFEQLSYIYVKIK